MGLGDAKDLSLAEAARLDDAAPSMDPLLLDKARRATGFMPDDEGLALYEAGLAAAAVGPLLEIGSYCGKSSVYLGAAARVGGTVLYSVDHHRGSEEHQPGEGFHDPSLTNARGRVDTLPTFRRTIDAARLDDTVLGIAARSEELARIWRVPLGMVFIDGGHSEDAAYADLEGWSPHLRVGGWLVIHDVFPDPRDGGRPPYRIYLRALDSGIYREIDAAGSLRMLQRIDD